MICVGIDVSKDKHDCFVMNSDGEILAGVFTVANTMDGFSLLYEVIQNCMDSSGKLKVGLEATGHYSYNLLGFLMKNGLPTYLINPLRTNLYRKSQSLRMTKTDRIDARTIASMLLSDVSLKPYTTGAYHNEELKSLTRFRFDRVTERTRLKVSLSRLVNILFPELETLVSSLHIASVYALLGEYPGATYVSEAHLTRLTNLLLTASKGQYGKEKAVEIRNAARSSVGSSMPAKSIELQYVIRHIQLLNEEIRSIEKMIEEMVRESGTTITSVPGIGCQTAAVILAEIGDFSRFSSPDKVLAFAGASPSTYQSGKMNNCYPHMEKRGSKYLRFALYNAARHVCQYNDAFNAYLQKKRSEGKHFFVAMSHVIKKLVRLLYALETSGQTFKTTLIVS